MNKARSILTPFIALVRLHWIAVCIAAGLLLLYTLAGFFLVPYLARSQLESYVTEQLHRKVSVGQIRFNPFTFEASVANFKLSEANDKPLIAFRHLYVNAELASLWQRAVVLKEIQLVAPGVNLVVEKDSSVNLARLAPAPKEPPPEKETALPRVRIGTLAVTEGLAALTDYTRAKPFTAEVAPIKFTLNDFRTDVGYENAYNFAGTTLSGEHLEWSGEFTVQPLGSTGQFRVDALKAATIDAYLYESLPFKLASGQAALNGSYRFELEPFALDVSLPSVAVRDLKLAERAKPASVPIALPELDVKDVAFSYTKRDVGLKLIELKNAHIDVAREQDGSISLSRLMNGESSQPTSKPAAPSSAASPKPQTSNSSASGKDSDWTIHVDSIRVDQASIVAEDRSVSPATKFELTPVNLTVDRWSTDPSAKLEIDADVTINKKGKLLAKGELQLEPLSTQLAVNLTDFALPVVQPYLEETTAMTLHSGDLTVKGDVSFAATPENAPPIKFTGEAQVANLRTTDQFANEDFVKWRNLAVTGISFGLNPDRLTIDRIVARQPYAKVVIAQDTTTNVTRVLNPGMPHTTQSSDDGDNDNEGNNDSDKEPGDSKKDADSDQPPVTRVSSRSEKEAGRQPSGQQAAASGEVTPFPIRIKTVQFIDGSANFADHSIDPSFASGILELNGTVTGLSSDPASRAKVKLDGKVDKYAPVDISGEANLLSAAKYTDLSMNFHNMELTTFNPYSGKFAGYNISKGKLSTELKYHVEDRKLEATHHIVIDNLEFGAKTDSKDAAPIPLKLAVALLKDRKGIIDINLPVSGTLDDPKFRLGPIIWKAVLGLLTKIVTAPFTALGALFGGGEELAYVDFPAGSAVLEASESEKLNKVAKGLIERPQLKLSLPLTVVTEQDSIALAQTALATHLPPDVAKQTAPPTDDAAKRKRIAAYEKVYKDVFKSPPEYPAEPTTEKGDQKSADLDAKLQFLEHALLEKLKPDSEALNGLAQQRARAAQDALLANTELDPERVYITGERTEGKADNGKVRMDMKLE